MCFVRYAWNIHCRNQAPGLHVATYNKTVAHAAKFRGKYLDYHCSSWHNEKARFSKTAPPPLRRRRASYAQGKKNMDRLEAFHVTSNPVPEKRIPVSPGGGGKYGAATKSIFTDAQ